MARKDKGVEARIPAFVHDELNALVKGLAGEGNKTTLIAALIHQATVASAKKAVRDYMDERQRRASSR